MTTSNNINERSEFEGSLPPSEELKKGPWTAVEDAMLTEFVKEHGEGNWNAVQRKTKLKRCGKSCRLRWVNHLRPNLRKGPFTPEEESIVIQLHAKYGNRWARMAAQLPGRTDNEIKNFWNTRMKRRQRSNLPLYAQESQNEESTQIPQKQLKALNSSSPLSTLILSPSHLKDNDNLNQSDLPCFDPIKFPISSNTLMQDNQSPLISNLARQGNSYENNNMSLFSMPSDGLPSLSPISPFAFSSSSSSLIDRNLPVHKSAFPSIINIDHLKGFSNEGRQLSHHIGGPMLLMADRVVGGGLYDMFTDVNGLPSNQMPSLEATTSASSVSGAGACLIEDDASGKANSKHETEILQPRVSSELLDALVEESKLLAQKRKAEIENRSAEHGGHRVRGNLKEDVISTQSSIAIKYEEPSELPYIMEDDLSSLLQNFASATPLPDWYHREWNNKSSNTIELGPSKEGTLPLSADAAPEQELRQPHRSDDAPERQ